MSKDYRSVWNNCLRIIKDNIPAISFKTWFEPIEPIHLKGNVLTIQVPSPFFYEYLEEQYIDLLRKTLYRELGADAKLEYSVVMDKKPSTPNGVTTVRLPEKNKTMQNKAVQIPSQEAVIKNPFVIPGLKKIQINPQLNYNYTFDTFIEGDCNRLARSAGYAVAQNPGGTAFNPLMLYGDSGLGKTHLIQAIGNEVKRIWPDKTVLYVTANNFQTQYIESVRKNTQNDFLHFYQMIDVLIIDDVQEFAGKQKTQYTFFHIFNHLHQMGKQLILTSDKSPVELEGLEQRLLSRFKWGLSADLTSPDFKTRLAILERKIYNDGIQIPKDVIEYIAKNVASSVRELEGMLISLLAQSTHNRREINIELASLLTGKLIRNHSKELSIDSISKAVCDYFNMEAKELQSKSRKRTVVQARQIAMYFSKELTKSSLSTIGAKIGRKDHSTVLHAVKTVNNLIDTDKRFKVYVDDIRGRLGS